jgi:phenylpropionate dioxygenase-like ring-hydroxylating dioxygenase large terminal subunit
MTSLATDEGADIVRQVLRAQGQSRAAAQTLPPAAYTSPGFYEAEMEAVFRSDWVCVGHVSALPDVGSYFTVDLNDEPLVIVRGEDRIRALSRVCLHRWAPIVSGAGRTRLFSCPFHKWIYGLDGSLLAAPFMDGAQGFDVTSCKLPEVRCEVVEALGLLFVTFSKSAGAVSDRLEDLSRRFAPWKMNELVTVQSLKMDSAFNWKIQVETFMECYHHIGAHPTSFEIDQPARLSSCEDGGPYWSLCRSPFRLEAPLETRTLGLPLFENLTPEDLQAVQYVNVFPNATLAFRPDSVSLVTVFPDGLARTRATRITLASRRALEDQTHLALKLGERAAFSRQAGDEDNYVNQLQQAGASSRLARAGRLSPLETTVWDLANYVRGRLAANSKSPFPPIRRVTL